MANPDSEPSPTIILGAIKKMEEDMNTQFNHLNSSLQSVQASLAEHTTRIIDMEGSAGDHKKHIATLEGQYEELLTANKTMKLKLIDLEGRS
jgi:chromosome segregation ATPase